MKIYQMEKVITPPCNNMLQAEIYKDSVIYNLPVFLILKD